MAQFFISGTGTDAGKTFLTVALIRQLRAHGRMPSVVKPVASGTQPDDPHSDVARMAAALGWEIPPREAVQRLSAYSFVSNAAPALAARKEGIVMEWERIVGFCRSMPPAPLQLIEGAGGLFSPLTGTHSNADLAHTLGLPVILLGGTYLGSAGHIAATLLAARAAGIRIHTLVLNPSPAPGALAPAQLEQMLRGQTLPLPPVVALERESVPPMLEILGISPQ